MHLAEKKGRFSISCKLTHDGVGTEEPLPDLVYTAEVSLSEIPEDTELRTEITATLEGGVSDGVDSSIVMNLKVCVPDVLIALLDVESQSIVMWYRPRSMTSRR